MYRFWNACNLRFNICAVEWKNGFIETNGYAIDLSIGASKWNMCELLVEFKYRRVSKGTKDISEFHMYRITICYNGMGFSLEPLKNEFQYNLLLYRQHYMNLLLFNKFLLDIDKEISDLAITLMLLFNAELSCEPADLSMELPACLWCHLPFWGISPKEGKIMKQMSFKLNEHEELQTVWNRLPESNQREIKRLYAKLIAQAAKSEICAEAKEEGGGDVE